MLNLKVGKAFAFEGFKTKPSSLSLLFLECYWRIFPSLTLLPIFPVWKVNLLCIHCLVFGQQRIAKHGCWRDRRGAPSILVSSHSLPISILTAFNALLRSKTLLLALLAVLIWSIAHTLRGAFPDLDLWTSPCWGLELKHQHWVCSIHLGAFHWYYFRISVPQHTLPHQFGFFCVHHSSICLGDGSNQRLLARMLLSPLFPFSLGAVVLGSLQSNLNPCRCRKDPADCVVLWVLGPCKGWGRSRWPGTRTRTFSAASWSHMAHH